jgi:hypothetical protein
MKRFIGGADRANRCLLPETLDDRIDDTLHRIARATTRNGPGLSIGKLDDKPTALIDASRAGRAIFTQHAHLALLVAFAQNGFE